MIKLLKDNIYFIKGKQSGHFYSKLNVICTFFLMQALIDA